MKMHMKNPLWVTNPHVAKREFEREFREKFGEKEGKDPIWLASQVRKEVLAE